MARRFGTVVCLLACGAGLVGCGARSESREPPPSATLEPGGIDSLGRIVVTAEGAQHIGLQTARATAPAAGGGGATVVIPLSSMVYDASGRTFAFTNPSPLVYTEVPVTVGNIVGTSIYLTRGPAVGARVVTVGAQELFGVETGVYAQT